MRSMLAGTPTGDSFVKYFQPAIENQFNKIGFTVKPGDSHIEKRKRATIVSLAVSFNVQEAKDQASELFSDWKSGKDKPHPDVRGTVYNLGVANGDYDDWKFVYDQASVDYRAWVK